MTYRKKSALAGLLILGINFILAAGELISPDYAETGRSLTVFVSPEGNESFSGGEMTLSRGEGRIDSRTRFFLYPGSDGADPVWCALMGIPSDLAGGTYTLSCRMDEAEGTVLLQKRLGISPREYPAEVLVLNTELTDIRTKEDPEKTAQAQKLWSLLASFETESRFSPGKFVPPMDEYRVTTDFGCRRIYRYNDGSEASSVHNGWDWAGPTGTPIKAVGKGRIVMAEERIVTGNTVMLELLPGVFMLYYHMDELRCAPGDMVEPGQVIGTLGMTGLATGPHLHWELRISRVAVDPLPFLDANLIDKSLYME